MQVLVTLALGCAMGGLAVFFAVGIKRPDLDALRRRMDDQYQATRAKVINVLADKPGPQAQALSLLDRVYPLLGDARAWAPEYIHSRPLISVAAFTEAYNQGLELIARAQRIVDENS